MRLRTLPLSLSGILMGTALANFLGYYNVVIFILAILTTISFQVLSNFANDLGDTLKGTDNDNRVGPQRTVQTGLITIPQMKKALLFNIIISLILSVCLILESSKGMNLNLILTFLLFAILSILSAIGYTMGKKAYGYYGLGDLMVFVFFGVVSVFGSFTLFSKFLDIGCFLPAMTIGLLSVAVLNLNNLRDVQNDSDSGKKTLVVRIGVKNAKRYHIVLILLSFIAHVSYVIRIISIGCFHGLDLFFILVSLLPFLFLFSHLYRVHKNQDSKKLDPELKIVAFSTFVCSMFTLFGTIFMNY